MGGEVIEMRIAVFKHDSVLEYRDATPEEIAEMERQQAEMPEPEPSPEERMEAQVLYTALMTDTLLEV